MLTRLILAALVMPAPQEAESYFPAKDGSVRHFAIDSDAYRGKGCSHKYELVGKREFTLIDADGGDVEKMKWRKETAGPEDFHVSDGDESVYVVRKTKDEIRVYKQEYGTMFVLHYVFPRELKAGLKWKGAQVYLSCGFGVTSADYETAGDKVTVPAGTFEAIRVDIASRFGMKESIWFARGKGIVKWKSDRGTMELSRVEEK